MRVLWSDSWWCLKKTRKKCLEKNNQSCPVALQSQAVFVKGMEMVISKHFLCKDLVHHQPIDSQAFIQMETVRFQEDFSFFVPLMVS